MVLVTKFIPGTLLGLVLSENGSHRLKYLKFSSLVGEIVWRGYGTFRTGAFLEGMSLGMGFESL